MLLACADAGAAAGLSEALCRAGFEVTPVRSVPEALDAARRLEPDALVAEAILPGGDGESLARDVLRLPLNRFPDLVLLTVPGFALPDADRLRALGAALVEKPASPEALTNALAHCRADPGFLPPPRAERLAALLNRLGVPPHPGRDMLSRAAALAWRDRRRLQNLQRHIYPEAGCPFGRTAGQAERAIRHVIEAAWRRGEIETQHKIFGDTIDAKRGRPTCGEMIAQLADILRWEG